MIPLFSIKSVTKKYGVRPLFEDISLVISEREKVALIGPNGSGKSTLLKLIAGLEHPDKGELLAKRELRLGYVPQSEVFPETATVSDVVASAVSSHNTEALVSVYLGKAGFSDKSQLVSTLSGGWKKRLAIVRELAKEPELLLLDEPTNHLDIQGILWLEEIVKASPFAILFVSHDRYFIEDVAQRVIELDRRFPKGFLSVDGQYSDFLSSRELFLEQLESYRDSLANKVRREVEWLRRGAKARTTKAKGRIKEANSLIDELNSINLAERASNLDFSSTGKRTKELLKAEGIAQQLGDKLLFKNLSVTLSPGVRLGVIGMNGSGKTTLLRTLIGELTPTHGRIRRANSLKIAFFDQARTHINLEETLQKALCKEGDSVVFNGREIHVTSWAKRFLFRHDQLNLNIKNLSGGEQARVLVAKLMLEPADILVLDEPTNDLDISTLEALEETLCEFSGAVVLVTHDRYMLDRISTSVIGLSGTGKAEIFADYTQWELQHQEAESLPKPKKEKLTTNFQKTPQRKKITYAERLELESMERKITEAERMAAEIEAELTEPTIASDAALLHAACEKLSNAHSEVDRLYARWQELEEKKKAGEEVE